MAIKNPRKNGFLSKTNILDSSHSKKMFESRNKSINYNFLNENDDYQAFLPTFQTITGPILD